MCPQKHQKIQGMSHLLSCHSHLDLTQTILREKTENKKCKKKGYPCTGVCLKVTVFAARTNISGFAAQLAAEFGQVGCLATHSYL